MEYVAAISVARGCGFAALAIVTMMFGLSGDMPNALQAGGILCLLVVAVLLLKAFNAPRHPYKRTELWIMLDEADRPPATIAQGLVSDILRRAYLRFAKQFAFVSALMLIATIILKVLRSAAGPQ